MTTEAGQEQKCQKRAATCDAYRVANQQRMAARRALKWIRVLNPRLVVVRNGLLLSHAINVGLL